ncbi:hypothetical protein niasHS_017022 [Heterodera schachtii]|uniref:BHLH domain-containing protein n=1 Tax=Heterodera schachtii TaxID=97005 RepID=A0ABD2HSY4_HETSC
MMNTNDIRHHQQQSSPLIGVHHQSPQVLSIEQFLRAAKLIEQHQLLINQPTAPAASADPSMLSMLDVAGGGLLAKLGEEYQERLLLSKMRTSSGTDIAAYDGMASSAAPNSTGSSRRSSPLSAAASPCSPSTLLMAQHQQLQQQQQQLQQQRFCGGGALTPTTSAAFVGNNSSNSCGGRSSCASRSSINATTPPATGSSRGGGSRGASRQSRAAHNELEKNRRANLRGHLEALKAALPPEADTQRDTTLSLLTRARNHIRTIKEQHAQLLAKRTALLAEHLRLKNVQQRQQQQQQLSSLPSVSVTSNSATDNNNKQRNHNQLLAVPATTTPMPTKSVPVFVVPTTTMAPPPPAPTQYMTIDDDADSCLLVKKTSAPASSMADRDLLEMQGLIPLLPQLYPYKHPSPAATIKLIGNRLIDY